MKYWFNLRTIIQVMPISLNELLVKTLLNYQVFINVGHMVNLKFENKLLFWKLYELNTNETQ